MTTPILRAGQSVRIPAHSVAGQITTFWGEPGQRRVSVELADGTIMTVTEADIVADNAAPPPLAPRPAPCGDVPLIDLALALVRLTDGQTGAEAQALNQLARDYLRLKGAA